MVRIQVFCGQVEVIIGTRVKVEHPLTHINLFNFSSSISTGDGRPSSANHRTIVLPMLFER
jgi:hypothetical protein